MSRGLGRLQKAILCIAYERSLQGKTYRGIDTSDVLIRYYGFPVVHTGQWLFSKTTIGKKRYESGTVTAYQSIRRLVKRGMLGPNEWGYGCVLTPLGLDSVLSFNLPLPSNSRSKAY